MNNRICRIAFVIGLLMVSSSVYGQNLEGLEDRLRRKIEEAEAEFWRKRGGKNKGGEDATPTVSSEEIKAKQEAERREQRKKDQKRVEEERKRSEKAFREDKEELSKSLKGLNGSGKSSGFSTGLRSLSDDNSSTGGKSNYGSGLRMYTEESPSTDSYQKGTYEAYFNEETKTYEHSTYKNRSSLSKETVTTFSPTKSVPHKPQKSYDYMPVVVETGPRPVYYQGPAFYTMGAEESGESLIDKVENQIDVWREAGEHKVLTYVGEKLTGLARKTVSTKSAMGAQVMKVYDIINDALGVFNLQKNIATRTFDAVKESAITEDSRYVDEVNRQNKADVDNHYHRYMVDHGLLPPDAKQAEKQMKKEIKKEAEKTAEIWLGRIIK